MRNISILLNASLRKEVEVAYRDILNIKQFILIVVIINFVILPLFYLFLFLFIPDPVTVFSKSFVFAIYFAACIIKFIILDFIVRPKVLKQKKRNCLDF